MAETKTLKIDPDLKPVRITGLANIEISDRTYNRSVKLDGADLSTLLAEAMGSLIGEVDATVYVDISFRPFVAPEMGLTIEGVRAVVVDVGEDLVEEIFGPAEPPAQLPNDPDYHVRPADEEGVPF